MLGLVEEQLIDVFDAHEAWNSCALKRQHVNGVRPIVFFSSGSEFLTDQSGLAIAKPHSATCLPTQVSQAQRRVITPMSDVKLPRPSHDVTRSSQGRLSGRQMPSSAII